MLEGLLFWGPTDKDQGWPSSSKTLRCSTAARFQENWLALSRPFAAICEVMCLSDQEIKLSVSSYVKPDGSMVSKPLEDMFLFMDRQEFMANMIVKPLDE